MQITANHKKPGDNTPCDGCARVRTETYVLTVGDKTVRLCHTCWPAVCERVAAIGVQLPDDRRDELIEELRDQADGAEVDVRDKERYIDRLESDRHTLEEQNRRLREEVRQLQGHNV